jgi:signal transduction histidine kinase
LPGDHPVETRLATEGWVWADPDRIGQVLRNLLDNAAKYSPPGAPIEVRAEAGGSQRIRVAVADRGIGIRPDELPRIFEKFQRGRDLVGTRAAGLGLGLYLSRRIVHAHGAILEVEATPGVGSTFAFELEMTR